MWTARRRRLFDERFMGGESSAGRRRSSGGPAGRAADPSRKFDPRGTRLTTREEVVAGCDDRGDFVDSFKGAVQRTDYRERPNELPGHGRTRKRLRVRPPRLGPAARKSRARGADRLRLGSSRGSGGPVCLLAHWESGLMATRKPSPRNRAVRPAAEDLESRHLLSKVVSGTDIDGDTWTLRLFGRGSLTVVKQPIDPTTSDSLAPLNSATEINQIIVGGTDPLHTRLVGHVTKGPM